MSDPTNDLQKICTGALRIAAAPATTLPLHFGRYGAATLNFVQDGEEAPWRFSVQGLNFGLERGFVEIAEALGVDFDLADSLPDGMKAPGSITFDGFAFVYDGRFPASAPQGACPVWFAQADFNLGGGSWEVWPGHIALQAPKASISLDWTDLSALAQPSGYIATTGARRVSLTITDRAFFGKRRMAFDVSVNVTFQAPRSVRFLAVYVPGTTTVGVADFAAELTGFSLHDGEFGGLAIAELAVSGDLDDDFVRLSVALDGAWTLLRDASGHGVIELERVGLDLMHGALGVSGDVQASFTLGKDSAHPLVFDIEADYLGAGAGWTFFADLECADELALVDLVGQTLKTFCPNGPPPAMNSVLKAGDFQIKSVALRLETATNRIVLGLTGVLTADGVALDAALGVDLAHDPKDGWAFTVTGLLRIGGKDDRQTVDLAIVAQKGQGSDAMLATLDSGAGASVDLGKLIESVAPGASGLSGPTITIKQAALARIAGGWLFNVDIDGGLDLSAIRVPGLPIGGGAATPLHLAFDATYATGALDANAVATFNALLPSGARPLPAAAVAAKTAVVNASIAIGDKLVNLPLDLSLGSGAQSITRQPATATTAATAVPVATSRRTAPQPAALSQPAAGGTHWIDVQRNFGAVHVDRVGVAPTATGLKLEMSADLRLGPLTVSLLGLGMSVPLPKPGGRPPTFTLDGLGLAYAAGAITVGGALMRTSVSGAAETTYSGAAVLAMPGATLSAAGSFAKAPDGPSLFLFGALQRPLGGPPACFVTGVAAGLGVHRRLVLPKIDDVATFPLIQIASGASTATNAGAVSGQPPAPADALTALAQAVPISPGDSFLCAGLKFTSFKIVDTVALLAVQFGRRTEIDLLGLSTAIAPPEEPEPRLLSAQLALKASYIVEEGILSIRGKLTPASYILSPDCHLSGSFAVGAWFGHAHNGDFVMTLGGYHPRFLPPAHYPQDVPRLAFNWPLSSNLLFKGDLYFALTGNCLMAGGAFSATYSSGSVRAWFSCAADFLVTFKPFHYDASLSVDLGASVTIHFFGSHTLSFDAGADLHLWGPPLTGHAHVHLSVLGFHVSFDVDFGSAGQLMKPVAWKEFETSFLPPLEQRCVIAVESGLGSTVKDTQGHDVWVVDRRDVAISVTSVIPNSLVRLSVSDKLANGGAPLNVPVADPAHQTKPVSIRPMGVSSVNSTLTVTLSGSDLSHFRVDPIIGATPNALWGAPELDNGYLVPPDANGEPLAQRIRGVRLSAHQLKPAGSTAVPDGSIAYDVKAATSEGRWNAASEPDAAQADAAFFRQIGFEGAQAA